MPSLKLARIMQNSILQSTSENSDLCQLAEPQKPAKVASFTEFLYCPGSSQDQLGDSSFLISARGNDYSLNRTCGARYLNVSLQSSRIAINAHNLAAPGFALSSARKKH